MERLERTDNEERFPGSVSVSLLLTHGRSGRLLMTRHGVKSGEKATWGLIAGGVEKGESAWQAATREAKEEADVDEENIIFVKGRNILEPHVALINRENKVSVGLVYDVTYSGPKVSLDGWEVKGDSVDRAKFFTWQETLELIERPELIYKPEFNLPQLIRWNLMYQNKNESRMGTINGWLHSRQNDIQGLIREDGEWRYFPPYNDWMNSQYIHGDPVKTNFARPRFYEDE